MKKLITLAVVAMTALCASAQDTEPMVAEYFATPEDYSVFVPTDYDGNVGISFNYGVAHDTNVVAVVNIGGTSTNVPVFVSRGSSSVPVPVASLLANKPNGTAFTVTVPSVKLGRFSYIWDEEGGFEMVLTDSINTQAVTYNYQYRTAVPTCVFSPNPDNLLTSPNFNLSLTFSEPITCPELQFSSGSWRIGYVETVDSVNVVNQTTISVSVDTTYWNLSQLPAYLTVQTSGLKIGNYKLPNVFATYQYGEEIITPATFIGTEPDSTYNATELAENYWFIRFLFDGSVELDDIEYSAVVKIYDASYNLLETFDIETSAMWADEDWWNNYFYIEVPTVDIEEYLQDGAKYVEYSLIGVKSHGVLLSNQPVVTYTVQSVGNARRNANAATGLDSIKSNTKSVKVYSLSGNSVGALDNLNINKLPKGIYIVEGKKIIVK